MRLGYRDVDTFVTRFAPNVTRGGVFISSKQPRAVGDTFRFEIALAGGPTVLSGQGKVTWIREFDPNAPRQPHGMGVQFLALDEEAFPILERLLAAREGARVRRRSAVPSRSPSKLVFPLGTERKVAPVTSSDGAWAGVGGVDEGVSEASIERALAYARSLKNSDEAGLEQIAAETAAQAAGGAAEANGTAEASGTTLDQALSGLSKMLRPRSESGLYRLPPDSED